MKMVVLLAVILANSSIVIKELGVIALQCMYKLVKVFTVNEIIEVNISAN